MTLCPKCGKPGGVELFLSVSPCDACLALVRTPERAETLPAVLVDAQWYYGKPGWVSLQLMLRVDGREFSQACVVAKDYAPNQQGTQRALTFLQALAGRLPPTDELRASALDAIAKGFMNGIAFPLPRSWVTTGMLERMGL